MCSHQVVQQPWVDLAVQRPPIRKDCRQGTEFLPELLQIKVEIEIDAEQQQRRDPVKPNNGNTRLDNRKWRGGPIGDQIDICGSGNGEPGVKTRGQNRQKKLARALGDVVDVLQAVVQLLEFCW